MLTVDNYNFKGKKVLVRVDYNVPLDENLKIVDDTRIVASLPTLNKIINDGGAIILMSHFGKPTCGYETRFSLKHIVEHLSKLLKRDVKFADNCIGEAAHKLAQALQPGEVLLLENLRFHREEKESDMAFSRQLASLGDVYVNDAFGTAHRNHSSTAAIARFFPNDKMIGLLIQQELEILDKVLLNYNRPSTVIIGGSKVSTKILVITEMMKKADTIIIGGGMAYTFIKAMGGNIGSSMIENDKLDVALKVIREAIENGVRLVLPKDNIVADSFSNDANIQTCSINDIKEGWMGLDIGPETCRIFSDVIKESKTIMWNGPMGVFEMPKFSKGTECVAKSIVEATKNGSFSLIGGGDSVGALKMFNLADKVSYISTGGGALLRYIEGEELPAITAITG
ncbi:MAG: phosphoglycerate kinase, phosphoglycerate kinase [Candidatus Peregrinibacteria bacterium GW2011_GWF2_33_10]|nr:MAG: phosphoglycerate kinase, phosphoglycerate kinase [Candidatus Peregrinibacteria bacterium GW2011_GWF2_33_10]